MPQVLPPPPRNFPVALGTPLHEASQKKRFLGIDPGASGGFALILAEKSGGKIQRKVERLEGMPKTLHSLWSLVNDLVVELEEFPDSSIVMEKVGGYIPPKKGENFAHEGNPGSAMFKFGENYGQIQMALVAAGFPLPRLVSVTPGVWQNSIGTPKSPKGKGRKTKHKAALKEFSVSLFPTFSDVITLKTCDALLLAEFGIRKGW
jgi:hypothetical protein